MTSYDQQKAKESAARWEKVHTLKDAMKETPCPNCSATDWQIYSYYPQNNLQIPQEYGAECRQCGWDDRQKKVIEVKGQERKKDDTAYQGYKSKVE